MVPTLVPKKSGDCIKTDRRDAFKLARSHRSGNLTAVWIPDEGSEALRDLIRACEAAKQDQLRARHRLTKFLLRTGRRAPLGVKAWRDRVSRTIQPEAAPKRVYFQIGHDSPATVDYADPGDDDSNARSGFADSHYSVGFTRGMP